MTKRFFISQLILWLFVLSAGVVSGGSIYDELVVEPLWAGAPPESIRSWTHGVIQGRFFGRFSPLYGLFSLALLIVSWFMPRRQRRWAFPAGLLGIVAILSTALFFMPIAGKLQVEQAGLSDGEIIELVNRWNGWQWLRTLLLVGSWILGLRAFSLSSERELPESEKPGVNIER